MQKLEHELYKKLVVETSRKNANNKDFIAKLLLYSKQALILFDLNLEPAKSFLAQCYAKKPRGNKPIDPIMMLRSLLLCSMVEPKINKWVPLLRSCPVLRMLCGIVGNGGPGVATYYGFMNRIHDGPIRKACEHQQIPSLLEKKRAKAAQTREKKSKKQRRKEKKLFEKDPNKCKSAPDSVTARLVSTLKESQLQPNANDILGRLSELLFEVAIKVSAKKGLLGDVKKLQLCGDGSPLRTAASRHGKKTCDCGKRVKCDCPRIYSDPDANIGWDSHRKAYFYGHHIYEIVCSSNGHDLPMAITLDKASTSDHTASLETFEHLRKTLLKNQMAAESISLDAGHDGKYIYEYLEYQDVTPIIALAKQAPAVHPKRKDIALSNRGVPVCSAGHEMTLIAYKDKKKHKKQKQVFGCPLKAGTIKKCPNAPADVQNYSCRPIHNNGPMVVINAKDNPRLFPPIPRNHKEHTKRMKLRSGSERSFSVKKEKFGLEAIKHRRKSFWLIRLYMIAILQHAMAWVAKQDAKQFVHYLLGTQQLDKAA